MNCCKTVKMSLWVPVRPQDKLLGSSSSGCWRDAGMQCYDCEVQTRTSQTAKQPNTQKTSRADQNRKPAASRHPLDKVPVFPFILALIHDLVHLKVTWGCRKPAPSIEGALNTPGTACMGCAPLNALCGWCLKWCYRCSWVFRSCSRVGCLVPVAMAVSSHSQRLSGCGGCGGCCLPGRVVPLTLSLLLSVVIGTLVACNTQGGHYWQLWAGAWKHEIVCMRPWHLERHISHA